MAKRNALGRGLGALLLSADEVEKSSNRKIFYCENNMYAPSFSKVKEIIEEGALGEIYMGRGKEQHSGPHSAWFYKQKEAGGGALLDLGIHDIACLNWYLNDASAICLPLNSSS